MAMNRRDKMISAATQYDVRQSKRRGYNPYALARYFEAIDRVEDMATTGVDIRTAITHVFCGGPMNTLLKALGESPANER